MAKETSSGITFSTALFLVFLVLKLHHDIDWSWWWVTAPLWGFPVLFLSFVGVMVVMSLIGGGILGLKLFVRECLRSMGR